MKNGVQFKIKGLNQEKNLNILSKTFSLHDIVRLSKNMATFKVSLLHAKKVRKKLKDLSVEILEERRLGIFPVRGRTENLRFQAYRNFPSGQLFGQVPAAKAF